MENFEEIENFLRKFYTFYEKIGKFNWILVRYKGFLKKLKTDLTGGVKEF